MTEEPQFKVLTWKNGQHIVTQARATLEKARYEFDASVRHHAGRRDLGSFRVELYDGPEIISMWASDETFGGAA